MKINFYSARLAERFFIKKVLNTAAKLTNQPQNIEFAVTFVSEEEIRRLNASTRAIDASTDVLSFPLVEAHYSSPINPDGHKADLNPKNGNLPLGDIVICRRKALIQAKEYGHGPKREICFLALHGFLHLVGYDHVEEKDREIMEKTQDEILAAAGVTR